MNTISIVDINSIDLDGVDLNSCFLIPGNFLMFNKKNLGISLYLAGLLFIVYLLAISWQEIKPLLSGANYLLLFMSTLMMLLHTYVGCRLLFHLFINHDVEISLQKTCRVFYLSQLAKYLPGVIWGFALQASFVKTQKAVSKVTFANLEMMLYITSSFFFFCLAILVFQLSPVFSLVALGMVFVCITVLKKYPVLHLVPVKLGKLMSLHELPEEQPSERLGIPSLFLICVVLFVSYFIAISCIIFAFYEISIQDAVQLAIYQCFAWIIGVVTFIIPAGMGIREVIFLGLGNIGGNYSQELLQSLAILLRFVQMLQDIMFSLGAILLIRLKLL